jgi:predicted transcriptional regulator
VRGRNEAMTKANVPQPTPAELEILQALWRQGASTVREVQESLERDPPVRYTTVLKLLQIMTEKGLVTRDERERTHVYRAAVSERMTKKRMVVDLLDRVFEGSALGLVQQALSARPAGPEDLKELRKLLEDLAREET